MAAEVSIKSSLSLEVLTRYVGTQLTFFFPDDEKISGAVLRACASGALDAVAHSFKHVSNAYFYDGKNAIFNHRNSDHYCVFLYWLSRIAATTYSCQGLAEKAYLLNKTLHGLDAFYEVELPSIFAVVHPVGTVLGRATYSDFFLVYQRCGVGTNDGRQPRLGSNLTMHPGASVLGNCEVGNGCAIGTDSLVLDFDLDSDTTYVGRPGAYKLLTSRRRNAFWNL